MAGGDIDAARVYLPLETNHIVALSRETGEEAWTSQDVIETAWPPVAAGPSVFVMSSAGLYELDGATGRTLKRVPLPGRPTGAMTLVGSLLLVPVEPDLLIALRGSDGGVAWTASLGAPARVAAAVNADRTAAFVALADSRLAAYALDSGKRLWVGSLGGELRTPVPTHDRVIVGSSDNTVYARQAATGREAWHWTTGGDVVGVTASGDAVYLASLDNTVLALNRSNGNLRWLRPLGTRPVAPPHLTRNQVLVAGVGPTLAGFDADSGAPGATFVLEGDLETAALDWSPLVAPDSVGTQGVSVVLIMRDGRVVGLRPSAKDGGGRTDGPSKGGAASDSPQP